MNRLESGVVMKTQVRRPGMRTRLVLTPPSKRTTAATVQPARCLVAQLYRQDLFVRPTAEELFCANYLLLLRKLANVA
jgi:hypothetical protein